MTTDCSRFNLYIFHGLQLLHPALLHDCHDNTAFLPFCTESPARLNRISPRSRRGDRKKSASDPAQRPTTAGSRTLGAHRTKMAQNGQTSINIPQLLAVALVGFFAIRWYLSKPAGESGSNAGRAPPGRPVDVAKVDQVGAMFPQLDRRTIAWDLHRNGGSVAATTERILGGRGLDAPPPSYQPNLPAPAGRASTTSASTANKSIPGQQPDLITRYNLQNRISSKGKEPVLSEEQKRSAWSSDKAARADGLRKRREEMVLAARRKMQAKDAGDA